MIAMGVYLLATTRNPAQNVGNLWSHGGFLPNGMAGLVMAFPFVMFAFGGVETLSFAAAETENPRKVIPKAINQIIVRVLMFYVGAMVVLLSLTPWNDLVAQLKAGGGTYSSSPFVLVFSGLGESLAANLLNFVISRRPCRSTTVACIATAACCTAWPCRGTPPRFSSRPTSAAYL